MRYALIDEEGRVAQIADEPFPVAPSLRWVEVDLSVTERHWMNEAGEFYIPEPDEPPQDEPLPKLTIIHRLRDAGAIEDFAQVLALEENVYTAMIWDASIAFTRGDEDWEALKATLQRIDGLDVDAILA